MEEKELLHKVLQIIKDIENYTDTFVSQDTTPLVEIEIALDKTKDLYDTLHQMKREIIHNQSFEKTTSIKETVETEIDFDTIDLPFNTINQEEEIIKDESKIEEIIIPTTEEIAIEIVEQPIVIEEITIETPIVEKNIEPEAFTPIEEPTKEEVIAEIPPKIDTTVKENQSIFQSNNDKDLGSKLGKKPIMNISSAIGINDRFLFVKELFKNDISLYNSTIQTLNASQNFDTALQHIQSNFEWDFENATVQGFLSIVERRYL